MIKKGKLNLQFLPALMMLILILVFLPATFSVSSQISYGGKPAVATLKTISEIPVIRMTRFDTGKYLREKTSGMDRRLKPLFFAKPFPLSIDPERDGAWEYLQDGGRIWRISLESSGAYSLNVIFSRYRLNPGASVFVYNPDRSHILGAFDYRNNQPSGSLALSPVTGDRLIVEMHTDKGVSHYGELIIGKLNHDFTGILHTKEGRFDRSGNCNIDISCPVANPWQTEKNSVVRIMINGNELCTGVLVNNTSNDGTPYFLTANHCVDDSTKAANTVFIFGYESPFCNGGDGTLNNTLSGSDLLATQENLDFTLLEIRDMPPQNYRPWYAGWNLSLEIPESTVSIHHPQGDVKKIAKDYDSPFTATFGPGYTIDGHWRVGRWDIGVTERGSSGSPLFDQDRNLKGLLTGGEGRCGNAVNDFFCKFSLAWDSYEGDTSRLKPWLDPGDTGAESLQGINPYADNELEANFTVSTTGICAGDKVVFTDFSTGYPDSWHWDFGSDANPPSAFNRGPHFVEYSTGGMRTVSLRVETNNGFDTKEMEFDLSVKTTEIPVAGFSYTHENELFINFNDMSQYADSYYWEFGDGRTSTLANPDNTFTDEGEYTVKQLVRNQACSDTMAQTITLIVNISHLDNHSGELKIYPVPASSFVIIETDIPFRENSSLELFSVSGKSLMKKKLAAGETRTLIEFSGYPSGTYILRIVSGDEYITTRIPVIR